MSDPDRIWERSEEVVLCMGIMDVLNVVDNCLNWFGSMPDLGWIFVVAHL